MIKRQTFAIMLACAAAAGCAPASIAVPSDLVALTEKLELKGMGGWQDGRFRLGASDGRFSRRAIQSKAFDTFIRNVGGGSFEVAGPEFGGTAGGRCGFDEREVDLGVAVVSNGRLTYRCGFHRNGVPVAGGLFIAETPKGSGLLAGVTRAGDFQMGDVKLAIRAIHRMAGSPIEAGSPLGYAFDVNGRQVGAVDLNGPNKTIYAPRQPGAQRDAVLMASLALSVFWDPGA